MLSEKQIDAAVEAALHLLQFGLTPLLPVEVLRALWMRGGEFRALADRLAGEAAA